MKHVTFVLGPLLAAGQPQGMSPLSGASAYFAMQAGEEWNLPPVTSVASPTDQPSSGSAGSDGSAAPMPGTAEESARRGASPTWGEEHTAIGNAAPLEPAGAPAASPGVAIPQRQPPESPTATLSGSCAPVTTPPVAASPAPVFAMTLRRADNVPLGLEVRGEFGEQHLVVDAVRPGGAVEAWNRQCAGESREIRKGDRIIMINNATDADTMREECVTKYLLRMTVATSAIDPAAVAAAAPGLVVSPPISAPTLSLAKANSCGGLRAEAHEFVPQVSVAKP